MGFYEDILPDMKRRFPNLPLEKPLKQLISMEEYMWLKEPTIEHWKDGHDRHVWDQRRETFLRWKQEELRNFQSQLIQLFECFNVPAAGSSPFTAAPTVSVKEVMALFERNYRKFFFDVYSPIGFALEHDPNADAETAFRGTPLALLLRPVPLALGDRFAHTHVLGGAGAGKTSLLEMLFAQDIKSDASIVVIDPHSDFINRAVRADLGREPLYLNPRDIKHPIALNPFAVNQARFATYDETTKEQVTAGVIQTFDYLFSGLFNMALSGKQATFFRYVARLLLTFPETMGRNATILDMMRLIRDPAPYAGAIQRLPPSQREFFERDFASKTYAETREQVRYRLQGLVENPFFERLFTAPHSIDFFTAMNRGKIILIDTAKDFLKDGSAVFGKLIVSQLLQAVLERAALPEAQRHPTYILIDEAASFFGSNIDDFLTEARKFKVGMVLAHQTLEKASSDLKASLASNTSTKFVGGASSSDARAMAADMRTTPEFILSRPHLHFAAYVRNATSHAVSVPVTPGALSRLPPKQHFEAFIERNRALVSYDEEAPRSTPDATDEMSDSY